MFNDTQTDGAQTDRWAHALLLPTSADEASEAVEGLSYEIFTYQVHRLALRGGRAPAPIRGRALPKYRRITRAC